MWQYNIESPSKSEPFGFEIWWGLLINPLSKRFDLLGFLCKIRDEIVKILKSSSKNSKNQDLKFPFTI